jgi:hypothetical protein
MRRENIFLQHTYGAGGGASGHGNRALYTVTGTTARREEKRLVHARRRVRRSIRFYIFSQDLKRVQRSMT